MRKKTRRRDGTKERYWRGMIRKRERSGLTVRAFCARERVTESTYYFWRDELLKGDGAGKPSGSGHGEKVRNDDCC